MMWKSITYKNKPNINVNADTTENVNALADIVEKVLGGFNDGKTPFTIYLDLSKAFDTINHEILLWKLRKYGLSESALGLMESYLSDRQQYVCINGIESVRQQISTSVPQGSVLGPLLFLIYMNDISHSTDFYKFILFADDTSLFSTPILTELNNDLSKISAEFDKVCLWLNQNRLSLNVNKTKLMVFHHPQKVFVNPVITIKGIDLETVDVFKFLGYQIDQKFELE